ncbi:MAG: DNA replication complex GINS family protein [Candidatus Heimdallarchaeota archaeon]|nr:DNA replication complex GINS family protein [Candidatus Heimdallarchaeota archaeon]
MVTLISEEIISVELERIQYDFEELDVPVKCLKTVEEFDIGNRKIKLIKGLKLKVPFWLANLLQKEKLVELEDSENYDFPAIFRLADAEHKDIGLHKINSFFYILMKQEFEEYKKKGKSAPYRQRESIEMKLRELMTMRLSKIMKIAEKSKNITVKTRNMTPEEKWLYDTVSGFIEKWKDMVKVSSEETD